MTSRNILIKGLRVDIESTLVKHAHDQDLDSDTLDTYLKTLKPYLKKGVSIITVNRDYDSTDLDDYGVYVMHEYLDLSEHEILSTSDIDKCRCFFDMNDTNKFLSDSQEIIKHLVLSGDYHIYVDRYDFDRTYDIYKTRILLINRVQ